MLQFWTLIWRSSSVHCWHTWSIFNDVILISFIILIDSWILRRQWIILKLILSISDFGFIYVSNQSSSILVCVAKSSVVKVKDNILFQNSRFLGACLIDTWSLRSLVAELLHAPPYDSILSLLIIHIIILSNCPVLRLNYVWLRNGCVPYFLVHQGLRSRLRNCFLRV